MTQNAESDVAYCPHCANTAPQSLIAGANRGSGEFYCVTQCQTCRKPLLYLHQPLPKTDLSKSFAPQGFSLTQFSLVWPSPGTLHSSVPASVAKIYAEAAAIKERSPNGFAN